MKNNKLLKAVTVIALAIALAAPVVSNVLPTAIVAEAATPKISKSSITLEVKKTAVLKVTGTTQKAAWTSSNAKIASVDKKTGKVTAKKVGTATITGTIGSKKYTCKVKVAANPYSTFTKGKVSVQIPSDWKVEELKGDPTGMAICQMLAIPKNGKELSGVTCAVLETKQDAVDAQVYKELIESPSMISAYEETYKSTLELAWDMTDLEIMDMSFKIYKAPIGDMVKITVIVGKDKKEIGKLVAYEGVIDNYIVQTAGFDNYSDKTTPSVEEVVKKMIDTMKVK